MTQVLSRALTGAGHEVSSIGVYPQQYPAPDHEDDHGVQVRRLRDPGGTLSWAGLRWRLYREIARDVRRRKIDVVEVPDYQGWAAGWRPLGAPVVARLHGSETYFAAELGQRVARIASRLEGMSLRRADFWCSVCRYTADQTRALFGLETEPGAILYNPLEIPENTGKRIRTGLKVVFSGTLTPKKGVIPLIEAWKHVVAAVPRAELHIFGKDGRTERGGSMGEHLKQRLGPALSTVRFHGHVSREKLFEVFFEARVAVFPSYAEAFAVAPLESMASGCPTIYSRRGSGPELLADQVQGLLVDPDRPGEIAAAVIRVLRDDSFASRLGQAGRAHVIEKFSTGRLVAKNIEFYAACLEQFARPRGRRFTTVNFAL